MKFSKKHMKFRNYNEPLLPDEWVKDKTDRAKKIEESFSDAVKKNDSEMLKMYLSELCDMVKETAHDIEQALKVSYGER